MTTFSLETWKQQTYQKLKQAKDWLGQLKSQQVPYVVYGYLASMALWPLVEALGAGQVFPVMNALGTVAGSVGGNLLADLVQNARDRADLEAQIRQQADGNADLRQALDALLDKLEVVPKAYEGLNETDRQWFTATLREELARLGSLKRQDARLVGPGIIIQDSELRGGDRSVVGSQARVIITGDGNQVIFIGPAEEERRRETTDLRRAYLHHLYYCCQPLLLEGIDPKAATDESAARLSLGAVYTALLTFSLETQDHFGQAEMMARPDKRLSALAQLNRCQYLVLLGDPGSGKSTFVNFVAMCLAGAGLDQADYNLDTLTAPLPDKEGKDEKERQPWDHGPLLPVRVILRDFAAQGLPPVGEPASARHLWDFIAANLEAASLGKFAEPLQALLRNPEIGGLLLLDGLDEVPEADRRRVQLKQAVEDFSRAYPGCRVLVTSRTYAYQNQDWRLLAFAEARLAPFSRGQVIRFVDRWYGHVAVLRGLKADDAQGRAELLKWAILGSSRLSSLAERPLLLTLMASLHAWRGGSLPEKRADLYANAVDLLLDTWETRKVKRDAMGNIAEVAERSLSEWLRVDRSAVRGLLERLAYQAHVSQPDTVGTADVPEAGLVSGLMELSQNELVNPILLVRYLSQRSGILLPRGVGVYTFPHRTFQEYLAACFLTNETYPEPVASLAREDPNRWREVALLAAAKAFGGAQATIWSLVEALCWQDPQEPAGPSDVWGAYLAGQALVEVADIKNVHPAHQAKVKRVKRWLVTILEQALLPATERAIAGQCLAMLGDERQGVALRPDGLPDIVWCEVPAGPFLMGSDPEKDKFALDSEQPQHNVYLPAFEISKYPVTNAQYQVFVKAGGYHKEAYWPEAIAAGVWRVEEIKVAYPIHDKGNFTGKWRHGWISDESLSFPSPLNLPNHPRLGINWYEALAFCHWISEQLGETIRLPTEAEWEKAARGTDGWRYPWGDEFNSEKVNCGETDIGVTSAVGCFTAGASPYGCEDMSGNVWEWTSTIWGEEFKKPDFTYPYKLTDGREDVMAGTDALRVMRGGAFSVDRRSVRCTARGWDVPQSCYYYNGFRLVRSSIISYGL